MRALSICACLALAGSMTGCGSGSAEPNPLNTGTGDPTPIADAGPAAPEGGAKDGGSRATSDAGKADGGSGMVLAGGDGGTLDDEMSPDELRGFEALPGSAFLDPNVVFPQPHSFRGSLESTASTPALAMRNYAIDLARRTPWPDEGPGMPAQNGLAYVSNSKNHVLRLVGSSDGIPGKCDQALHGLDCSGLVYEAGVAAGFTMLPYPSNVATLANPKSWQPANGFQLLDADPANLQAGDLVVWLKASHHIALVVAPGFGPGCDSLVVHSPGSSQYTCERNTDTRHGPVLQCLADIARPAVFGAPTNYYRLSSCACDWNHPDSQCGSGNVCAAFQTGSGHDRHSTYACCESYGDYADGPNPPPPTEPCPAGFRPWGVESNAKLVHWICIAPGQGGGMDCARKTAPRSIDRCPATATPF